MPCTIFGPEPEFFKLSRNPGIDSKESNPPAYVAGTTTLFLVGPSPDRLFKNSSTAFHGFVHAKGRFDTEKFQAS